MSLQTEFFGGLDNLLNKTRLLMIWYLVLSDIVMDILIVSYSQVLHEIFFSQINPSGIRFLSSLDTSLVKEESYIKTIYSEI